MKRTLIAAVALASLTACGSGTADTPEGVAQKFLSSVAEGNTTAASNLFPASCRADFLAGVIMAKAFGIDLVELFKDATITGTRLEGDSVAYVSTSADGDDDDPTKLVKVNAAGNPAPVNGKWMISCDETK